jgi:hypothetical protein
VLFALHGLQLVILLYFNWVLQKSSGFITYLISIANLVGELLVLIMICAQISPTPLEADKKG